MQQAPGSRHPGGSTQGRQALLRLGILRGRCVSLPGSVRVPHLGWNGVVADGTGLVVTGDAAFANSYCLPEAPPGWRTAVTTHGRTFVAAAE